MEGKYFPQKLGKNEYDVLGKTVSLMLRMCRPIFGQGKSVVLDSVFYVAKGITKLKAKGAHVRDLIKKRC